MRATVLLVSMSCAATMATAQDVAIRYNVGGVDDAGYTHHISSRALHVQFPTLDAVIEPGNDKLLTIDRRQQQYHRTDIAQKRRLWESFQARARGPNAPLASEQPAILSSGGARKEILGYAVESHRVSMGSDATLEVWMAPTLTRPSHYIASWIEAQLIGSAFGEFGPKAAEALESLPGLPLELHWRTVEQGFEAKTVVRAIEVAVAPIRPFQVPSGYREVPSPFRESVSEQRP